MIPKFECILCGECCNHIRSKVNKEDKEFLEEYGYGKMPLVQLHPMDKISFPLWDWEAKRFQKWEKDVNVDSKLKESRAILDLKSNKAIIVTYFMDSESCPFLSDKKCLIYNTKRDYICRFFPFSKSPFLKVNEQVDKKNLFNTCPGLDKIIDKIPDDNLIKALNEAFPLEFETVVQNDIIIEWVNKTIVDLVKSKKIRPAMNYPYEFLLKRIQNSKKIDFTDFLVEIGYYSKEEMEKMINDFDNNIDAKEKIKENMG